MDEHWSEIRRIFDAVCEYPSDTRRDQLFAMTSDPDVRREVLALLDTESRTIVGGRDALREAVQQVVAPELHAGELLGAWRLVRRLGAGGMGAVYLADRADDLYEQQAAIKLLHGFKDRRAIERLAYERRILAGLQHPGIARLYDGGTTPAGQPYLVMEYVDGHPLDVHVRECALALEARLVLFVRICRIVQAAHAQLVIHCDLKPGNVLVRSDGTPVLLDFGIAQLMEGSGSEAAGFFTPGYAAPELIRGDRPTIASDVFGLGMMLAGLLLDRPVRRDGDNAPPRPSALVDPECPWRSRLPGDLDAIVARACGARADARYGSVEALADDVERHLAHYPVRARAGDRLYVAGRFARRHWRGIAVGAGALALAAGFIWRLDEARTLAEREAEVARQVTGFMESIFQAADPRERKRRGADQITAAELLERAAARIDDEIDASPEVRARLKGVIGMAYGNMGDIRRSRPLLLSSAEELEAVGGTHIDEASRLFNMLASSQAADRDGAGGEALARRSLALLGPDWPDSFRVAQAWNSLAMSLMAQQRYSESEAAFEQARSRHLEAGREEFVGVATENLAILYRRWGRLDAAEGGFAHSLPLFERLHGRDSFDYWVSVTEHALLLADQGRFREARSAFETNLERAERIFGEYSIYYASENLRLGTTLLRAGAWRDAAGYLDRAIEAATEVDGEDSFNRSMGLLARAQLAQAQGRPALAETSYRQALDIRQRTLVDGHPDTMEAVLELGRFLAARGDPEGQTLIRQAIDDWLPQVPGDSANGLRLRLAEAELALVAGEGEAARRMLAAIAPELQGRGAELEARRRWLLARTMEAAGGADRVDAWQQAVAAAQAVYGEASAVTASWRLDLAEALAAAGDRVAAADQARRAALVLDAEIAPDATMRRRMEVLAQR